MAYYQLPQPEILGWNPVSSGKKYLKKKYNRARKKISRQAKKSFESVDWDKVNKTAMVVGPAVAMVYPPAAPAVALALVLTNAAARGDASALARVENIQKAIDAGVPGSEEALMALETAQAIRRNESANAVLTAAKNGDPYALEKLETISELKQSSPAAAEAYDVLRLAKAGNNPELQAKVKKVATNNLKKEVEEQKKSFSLFDYGL